MDLLKQLALPQSESQIVVLHLVLNVILLLLVPFLSYLFGALVLSLYHHRKGRTANDANASRFAKEVIGHVMPYKSIAVLFGVVPFLAFTFAYAQLLQGTATIAVSVLTWGALAMIAAAAFATSFYSATKLGDVIAHVPTSDDVAAVKAQMSETRRTAGKYALVFLFFAVLFLLCGISLGSQPGGWNDISTVIPVIFSGDVIVKVLQFLLLSGTLVSVMTMFFTFSWQGGVPGMNDTYAAYVKKAVLPLGLISLLLLPLFVVLSLVMLPVPALGSLVFLSAALIIVFVFFASHFVYGMLQHGTTAHAGNAFFMVLLLMVFFVVNTTATLSTATQKQSALLAYQYTLYHEELLAKLGIAGPVLTGEDIFNAKCSACHEFGAKKVGPAYKDVLPKYENDRTRLLTFVMNPVKMNPNFPPMPNQGLKPAEADSIAAYIMMMYKKK